jgi:hypothetical protein
MTTHSSCDHENTKAARAKCRRERANGESLDAQDKRAAELRDRPIPDSKPKTKKGRAARKVEKPMNTSLPHEFDEDMERPGRCWVCQLTKFARVHTDGPTDLARRFGF